MDEVFEEKAGEEREVMRGPVVHFKDYEKDTIKTRIESIKQFVSRLPASDKEKFDRE